VDAALSSIVVALVMSTASIVVAVITARGNAERLLANERIKRLEKKITDLGEDPNG
jgi:ABC-type spermidine/putrescine transport system permease subunit II